MSRKLAPKNSDNLLALKRWLLERPLGYFHGFGLSELSLSFQCKESAVSGVIKELVDGGLAIACEPLLSGIPGKVGNYTVLDSGRKAFAELPEATFKGKYLE